MKRRFSVILRILSLVLGIGIASLWARSYWRVDTISKSAGDRSVCAVDSYRGKLLLRIDRLSPGSGIAVMFRKVTWDAAEVQPEAGFAERGDAVPSIIWRKARWLGFGYVSEPWLEGVTYAVVIPFWFLVALTLSPWMAVLWDHWRRKDAQIRQPWRLCQKCGYDLRAHKAGEKCPECGTVIPAPPEAAHPRAGGPSQV